MKAFHQRYGALEVILDELAEHDAVRHGGGKASLRYHAVDLEKPEIWCI